MAYYFIRVLDVPFEQAVSRAVEALKGEGSGVLADIDVRATFAKKLGVEFRPYRILGASHPVSAYRALQAEDKIGLMLSCNAIIKDSMGGPVEEASIGPAAFMAVAGNPALAEVGADVRSKLERVIAAL